MVNLFSKETVEFLQEGAIPFALVSCERYEAQPVHGYYDEIQQVWSGKVDVAALTLTLTATPGDQDQDQD